MGRGDVWGGVTRARCWEAGSWDEVAATVLGALIVGSVEKLDNLEKLELPGFRLLSLMKLPRDGSFF